ncbi:MAG TPA: phosphoheptose isomerase, partial [Candidatus Limnocylindria bacterium]
MTNGPLDAAIAERLATWEQERVADRLWARDGSLWAESGSPPETLSGWLGWLDLAEAMRERVPELEHLARDVRNDGYTRAAVLGMGGSSLAPEVFSRTFGASGATRDGLELRILDSTHPDAVRGFREWAQSARTVFCV